LFALISAGKDERAVDFKTPLAKLQNQTPADKSSVAIRVSTRPRPQQTPALVF
jgi:hypothetical protein